MSNIIVGSERYYFNMYWEVEEYGDAAGYVFCDELDGYTFYPYEKNLKSTNHYNKIHPYVKELKIFLLIEETDQMEEVPCFVVEKHKRIYMKVGCFNKYWKYIARDIYKGIQKRTSNIKITKESINKRVDLSLLTNDSRTAKVSKSFEIEYVGKSVDIEKQRLISKKVSALADNKIRFVYAKSNPIIHDKSCSEVEKIECWDFAALETLPEDCEWCSLCKRKIVIRQAIESDTKHFGWYNHFFEKAQVSTELLERFLYHGKAQLHMDVPDALYIKYKEDRWCIKETEEKEKYGLYHNNYTIINENERFISESFHEQSHHRRKVKKWFAYIEGYDWRRHLESNEPEEMMQQTSAAEKVSWWRKLWEMAQLLAQLVTCKRGKNVIDSKEKE